MSAQNFFIAGDIDNAVQFALSQYNNGIKVFEFSGLTDLDISNLYAIALPIVQTLSNLVPSENPVFFLQEI